MAGFLATVSEVDYAFHANERPAVDLQGNRARLWSDFHRGLDESDSGSGTGDDDLDMATALGIALMVICAIELLGLFYSFQNGVVKWESLWVIFVELCDAAARVVVPDSEFVNFELKNGIVLPWLRFTGWLVTCPVLLMFLVSLTTHGGRDAAVPLVPLLVCNLMMLLLGITASACSATYLKWFIFGVACCFGGVVFASVLQCFRALDQLVPAAASGSKCCARFLSDLMAACFVGGWLLFPAMFALGHLGTAVLGRDWEALGDFCADLLAKNLFIAVACAVKQQYLRPAAGGGAPGAESELMRRPSELIYDDLCYDSREAVSRLASPSDPHAVAVRHAAAPHHYQHEAGGVCMVSPERSAKPYREAPYRGQQMEIEAYEPNSPRSGREGSPPARCVNGAALERARSARSSTPGSAGRTSVTPSSEPGGLGVNSQSCSRRSG